MDQLTSTPETPQEGPSGSTRARGAGGLGTWALALAALLAGCSTPGGGSQPLVQALRDTPSGVNVLTFHGDNARTGWNRNETTLTPANVVPETFGLLATSPDATDEIPGSPLFASDLLVHDQRSGTDVRGDVLFVGTMEDRVYALDGETLEAMWLFSFEGRRPPFASDLQACQSPYHVGVMSTPVISPDRSLLYVVGRVVGATARDTWLQGYALRTRDGSVAARFRVGETLGADGVTRTPTGFDGVDRGAPIHVTFDTSKYTQRSALLLAGNYLYVSTGGICDTPGFRGWLFAFDVTRLTEQTPPAGTFVPAPGGGGGMWAAGGAASDGTSVFAAVGNGRAAYRAGTPDAQRSIADALVRLGPTLAFDGHACFNVASPAAACGAGDAANLRNLFMPRNAELFARANIPDMDPDGDIGGPDEDFGSSGPLLVPPAELPANAGVDQGHALAALGGKDGFFYLIDRDRMGGVGPSTLQVPADLPGLVGAELDGRELYVHSPSGGIRATAAYFEGATGRYLYVIGADEIGGRADSPRGLAALRLRSVTDPTSAGCAAQYRQIEYQQASLPCATIWGSASRPGLELAWSGTGPLVGASPAVSSNGNTAGIVWVTFENPSGPGILQAYAAEGGAGTGQVLAPIYTSERVPADAVPGNPGVFAAPIVANGRVYVTGSTFVSVYGPLPRRTLPPVPTPPAPPNCAPGVSWESFGQGFVNHYCTSCHAEYLDLGFIQRRRDRVAEAVRPAGGGAPSMPLVQGGASPPLPTSAERATAAAWLRCGAPAVRARLHAGYAEVPAPGGPFLGDGDFVDPNRAGTLSGDRLMGAAFTNPYAPGVPDGVFPVDRSGPASYLVPVPGAGHYAVTLYFAENACTTGGPECHVPFNVGLAGTPWLTGFDILAAAGTARRSVARAAAIDLPATARLTIDLGAGGKLQALEVVRTDPCTVATDCPAGFGCSNAACQPVTDGGTDGGLDAGADASMDAPGGTDARADAGATDAGADARTDAGAMDAGADARADAGAMDARADAGATDARADAGATDAGADARADAGADARADAADAGGAQDVVPTITSAMQSRLRAVYLAGQAAGNVAGVFAKVGDDLTANGGFLVDVGCGGATFGTYPALGATAAFFSATSFPASRTSAWCGTANALTLDSAATGQDWTVADVEAPYAPAPADCPAPYDSPLRCELRRDHPAVALVMLGTHDLQSVNDLTRYHDGLTRIAQDAVNAGVIPVLSTIPQRLDSATLNARVGPYNAVVAAVAREQQVPLWDYSLSLTAAGMVNHGVDTDGIHPNTYQGGNGADLTSAGLRYGYNRRNLTALQVLAHVKAVVFDNGAPDPG